MPQNQAKADPYRLLLGISPTEERTHYRLLDIPLFESDLAVIENGRNRRNVALRQIKDGPLLEDAERIKEEIATAFRLLCNPELKAAYDLSLKEKLEPNRSQPATHPLAFDPKFSAEIREQQIEQFREVVREVFADGIVEEHEKLYLQQLHPKLGISAEVASQIFGEIAKETQERAKQGRLLKLAQQERSLGAADQAQVQREQSKKTTPQSSRTPTNGSLPWAQPNSRQQLPTRTIEPAAVIPSQLPRPIPQQSDEHLQLDNPQWPVISQPQTNPIEIAKARVSIPANGLAICSLLNMLIFGYRTFQIYKADQLFNSVLEWGLILCFSGALSLVYMALCNAGNMPDFQSLSESRWLCGLSIPVNIICFYFRSIFEVWGLFFILGPVFGIWGLIVLANKDVSSCFQRR